VKADYWHFMLAFLALAAATTSFRAFSKQESIIKQFQGDERLHKLFTEMTPLRERHSNKVFP
jgi:hypothetical protein